MLGIEALAADAAAKFRGGIAASVAVDLLVQPFFHRQEIPAGQALVQIRKVAAERRHPLGRVEISQEISRKGSFCRVHGTAIP